MSKSNAIEFGRVKAGYVEKKTTAYVDLRVDLYYNEERIKENIPIILAKHIKKELIRIQHYQDRLFRNVVL